MLNVSPSYGLSLCACGSEVFKVAVVSTRDYCMSPCVGGQVLACDTLGVDETPPPIYDDYELVAERVTCPGWKVPNEPPLLDPAMKREPTVEEWPPDFQERVNRWRTSTPRATFSWSNSRDLAAFLSNGRWSASEAGGVSGISDLGGPAFSNEITYRDELRCQDGLEPWYLPGCPLYAPEAGSNLVR